MDVRQLPQRVKSFAVICWPEIMSASLSVSFRISLGSQVESGQRGSAVARQEALSASGRASTRAVDLSGALLDKQVGPQHPGALALRRTRGILP